jgi:hypothetical protein
VQRRAARHGQHFTVEKLIPGLEASFKIEVLDFRQPFDWFRDTHDGVESRFRGG